MLKCDFHMHAKEDPEDRLSYSAKDLIKYAKKLNYDVLAITLHNRFFFNQDIKNFAKRHGILLIPGMEATVEGKHILFHDLKEDPVIFDFEELESYKDEFFITPAHPFYPSCSVGREMLYDYRKLWDFVEYSHFYTTHLNLNKSAEPFCRRFKIPFIGNSDAHHLHDLGMTYTIVDADKNKDSVLEAIRKHKFRVSKKPESPFMFFEDTLWSVGTQFRNVFK